MCGFNRRERSSRKRCLLTIWFQWWLARKKICDISGDPQVSQMTWLRLFYKCTASWFVCCLPWFWHSTDFCRSLGSSIICLEFVKDLENFRTRTCKCWLRFIFGPGELICPTLQMQVLWCRQLVILGDVFCQERWLWTSESKKTTNPAKGEKEKAPNILFHSLHAGGPLWSISRFWILKHLDRSWALCNHYNYDGCHFTGLQCGPAYHHYSDCIIASWLSCLMLFLGEWDVWDGLLHDWPTWAFQSNAREYAWSKS